MQSKSGNRLPPQKFMGLGALHMYKFATALRLRCPWLEWKDKDKIWVASTTLAPTKIWIFFMPSPLSL
jgi:hypothetical protein